jgi:hypothetical protein
MCKTCNLWVSVGLNKYWREREVVGRFFGLLKEWLRCGKLKEVVGMNEGEEGSEGGKEIEVL